MSRDTEQSVLEVIACSVADAIEAKKGGAGRLEIVRDLQQGGLTPSFELVREIKNAVDLPLRVMVRESVGYETNSEFEIEELCNAAEHFASLEVDGLVLGFLHDETVDIALTERILGCAPNLKATFHHAFEDAKDQLQALKEIKRLTQVDRILSSGGLGELSDRSERLATYERLANPAITILAGGGIDSESISFISRATPIREFHVGKAARDPNRVDGVVKAKLVRNLVRIMRGL
jgi:copper homeostasis protein